MLAGMEPNEDRFRQVLLDAIAACEKFKYRPHRFREMIETRGAFAAIRDLLDAPEISDGFGTLAMNGRLDLSAEAIALRPEWQRHFTAEQRQTARRRLHGTPFALPDA